MKPSVSITGEQEAHKVAAIFETESDANGVARVLSQDTSLDHEQVIVVSPQDQHPGEELEPENQGIWQTLVRSHLWLGIGGAVAGFIVFLILSAVGVGFIAQNGVVAAAVLAALGLILGLLLAGGVTLRPDHTPYVAKAQSALREGKYVLTVHASSSEQLKEATAVLKNRNVQLVRTI